MSWCKMRSISGFIVIVIYAVTSRRLQESTISSGKIFISKLRPCQCLKSIAHMQNLDHRSVDIYRCISVIQHPPTKRKQKEEKDRSATFLGLVPRITPDFRICMHNFGPRANVTPTCWLNLSIRNNFQFDCSNHDAILAQIHSQALVTNPWTLLSSFRSKNIASVVSRSFHSLLFHFVIRSWHLN